MPGILPNMLFIRPPVCIWPFRASVASSGAGVALPSASFFNDTSSGLVSSLSGTGCIWFLDSAVSTLYATKTNANKRPNVTAPSQMSTTSGELPRKKSATM
eukprot:GHVS01044777.1.p2 GENE.GHVS01044777.1~~GHVS01044777.1.p2  ORF type:complete len:101 (-),score=7.91 GHVS01044777.1:176-478(-)